MLTHPQFDPIALQLGPLAVRWYGLMYLAAFVGFLLLGNYRAKQQPALGWDRRAIDDLLFAGVLGVILGGRLGYVLFYKPGHFLQHPAEIIAVWLGGMSFHGGLLGVLIAAWWFSRSRQKRWLEVTDFIAPLVPLGLACGRLANFINGELWGRPTDVAWAMIFPQVDNLPRHPSQLYQFALEGLTLFVLLWWYSARPRPTGAISGAFLTGYGCFRFIAEFGRQPDDFLGLLTLGLSMGQWLSIPMIGFGLVLWTYSLRKRPTNF